MRETERSGAGPEPVVRRVLVVDDEPLARERVATLVARTAPTVEIREAGNGTDAVAAIAGWRPDVVFLDVQMPECDGFETVTRVGVGAMPATVFVTAYQEHALHAFEVAAVDYLLKPFDDERFASAWARLVERVSLRAIRDDSRRLASLLQALGGASASGDASGTNAAGRSADGRIADGRGAEGRGVESRYVERLVVKRDQRTWVVPVSAVQWAESSGNYVVLHAGKDRHELRETLTSLESRLDPARFARIHRRMVVAIDAIKELQPWFGGDQVMLLKDGTKLRVSRSYREHLASRLAGA